ncbi:glycosyltransferase [Prevotella sp. A2931]|uniref:Glycosyltransferase n=1 Tax=Prevotella illustrans TaxID=2800387 RepID=A0ABS3M400_9BACT|nr:MULTISPECIES: glycosyltransferase family 2 protein [Prevotella]MBO1362879.1 glycosyltransferase [Prevotella illustrans]PTL25943.1 glycosyltransferase [Prevotella sp. oral taxon 820]
MISVITVCYNSSKTISRTFESLLNQSNKDFEYIVIDGASTDGTIDIIKRYLPKFKDANIRLQWVSEPDHGIYNAMNKGIKKASGNIIGILNSDDQYFPWTIETISQISIKYPDYDIYHGLLKHISNQKTTRITGTSSENLYKGMIEHPTCFVRKKTYEELGAFDEKYTYVADYDLMLRYKKANKKFYFIEKILATFDEGGGGNSRASRLEALTLQRKYNLISREKAFIKRVREYMKQ